MPIYMSADKCLIFRPNAIPNFNFGGIQLKDIYETREPLQKAQYSIPS